MPARGAGLRGERSGWRWWCGRGDRPLCETAALLRNRRHLRGARG